MRDGEEEGRGGAIFYLHNIEILYIQKKYFAAWPMEPCDWVYAVSIEDKPVGCYPCIMGLGKQQQQQQSYNSNTLDGPQSASSHSEIVRLSIQSWL